MANKIEKILNITYHMEVQIKMTRHLFTLQMAVIKKRERDTGEDVEKLGSLYMVGENAMW